MLFDENFFFSDTLTKRSHKSEFIGKERQRKMNFSGHHSITGAEKKLKLETGGNEVQWGNHVTWPCTNVF